MLMLNRYPGSLPSNDHKCYYYLDIAHNDRIERRRWVSGKVDVLTPICKAYPSDEAWGLIGSRPGSRWLWFL